MKFRVTRSSIYWENERDRQPCEEAFLLPIVRTEALRYYDPGEWWYKEGVDHRIENDVHKRDFHETDWFVEISSLDDLLSFHQKHEDIVLRTDEDGVIWLEIYDDYRE